MDKYEQLEKIGQLKASGALSEAEYEAEKTKILASDTSRTKGPIAPPPLRPGQVYCKSCNTGIMKRKKKYVLGAGGAILRFLLMTPGIPMFIFGVLAVFGSSENANENTTNYAAAKSEITQQFIDAGLPRLVLDDILDDGVYDGDTSILTEENKQLISAAETTFLEIKVQAGTEAGANAVAGGMGFIMAISGLVLIAFGFLIGIRKWKLICNQCSAAINAA